MQHNVIITPHGRCTAGDPESLKLVSRPNLLVANTYRWHWYKFDHINAYNGSSSRTSP